MDWWYIKFPIQRQTNSVQRINLNANLYSFSFAIILIFTKIRIMKARTIVTGLLATVILSSCTVLSFYPLYTEKELVRDDRIIGKWQSFNNKDSYPTSENNTERSEATDRLFHLSYPLEVRRLC